MKVYVAGAYTPADGTEETRLRNIRLASETGKLLLKLGHTPFCPHTMTAGWEDECAYEDFLRMDLEWLRLCDAILLLPGWQTSRGARMEYEEALKEGLVIWDLERETEESVEVNRVLLQRLYPVLARCPNRACTETSPGRIDDLRTRCCGKWRRAVGQRTALRLVRAMEGVHQITSELHVITHGGGLENLVSLVQISGPPRALEVSNQLIPLVAYADQPRFPTRGGRQRSAAEDGGKLPPLVSQRMPVPAAAVLGAGPDRATALARAFVVQPREHVDASFKRRAREEQRRCASDPAADERIRATLLLECTGAFQQFCSDVEQSEIDVQRGLSRGW